MSSKHCPQCNCSTKVIKFGTTSSGRQRYKCNSCTKTWTSKPHLPVLAKNIWNCLVFHNMNISELSQKYSMSKRTIRRKLDLYHPPEIIPTSADVIAMDVTYFGRLWGILTVINVHNGKTLYLSAISGSESVEDYEKAILYIHSFGIYPKVAVIDGKKGVMDMLVRYNIKVQFCQFHQLRIITECITRNPDLQPNIELRRIALQLTKINEEDFKILVYKWKLKYGVWLGERTYSDNRRWEYTHKKTRRAINSLLKNMPCLFTYLRYQELSIPNTNNMLEGLHSELKRRLNNHRGLKKSQKIQFARIFFSGRTGV